MPAVFHDAAVTVGNARGTSLVVLIVAVPTLIVAMIRAAAGSRRAQIVWLGTLAYLVYNATIFAFGTVFNALFLFYAAMLSLSVWSLVALRAFVGRGSSRTRFRSSISASRFHSASPEACGSGVADRWATWWRA